MTPMNAQYYKDQGPRRAALLSILVLHALVVAALLSHSPARTAIANAMPIMVSIIMSEHLRTPDTPPRPAPMRQKFELAQPVVPLPHITTESEPSEQLAATASPGRNLPPIDVAPSATIAPALVAPRFDAAYLQNPAPVYPPLARRMGERGRVLLRVLVTVEGTADRVELNMSSGSSRLDSAALETVQRWRFVPARQGELAVAAWVLVPISFSLES